MVYNLRINGLVNRCSSESTKSRTLMEGAGFVKAKYMWISTVLMRQPSLKLVSFHKGFLLCSLTRCTGRSPAVAVQGHPHYGKDAEIGKGVAKLVPLHRTTGGSETPTSICEGLSP